VALILITYNSVKVRLDTPPETDDINLTVIFVIIASSYFAVDVFSRMKDAAYLSRDYLIATDPENEEDDDQDFGGG